MSETAREKFKKGQRVKMSALGLTRNLHRRTEDWTATVVGFGRSGVTVLTVRDGAKTPQSYHMDFLEKCSHD